MEQLNTVYYPIKINLDADIMKLSPEEGRFIKGTRFKLSKNSEGTGGDDKMITPIQANEIYCPDFNLPNGINQTIGSYEFRELNEIYWFVWNEDGNHSINMISGTTEVCQQVYKGSCLNFSLDPIYSIPENNVFIRVQYDEVNGVRVVKEKFLIFTDGYNNIRQINVLASIGSNSFTTSYFDDVYPYNDCCSFITLPTIAPMFRPIWELIPREDPTSGDNYDTTPNKLFNRAIQLAYQFVYVDGRQSTISPYGKPIIVGGTDCFEQNPDGLPRCAEVQLWAGNAFVEKINIYFRECTTCITGNCDGAWFLYDTIEKFDCQEDKKWYERTGKWANYSYNSSNNQITYLFCADKECTPVDQAIFTHIENEVPFKSMALTPIGDRIGLYNNLRGSENLTCEERDSFSVSVEAQPDDTCQMPKRKITVYMIIRNDSVDYNGSGGNECEFLFGDSGSGANLPIDGNFYFGGFGWRKTQTGASHKVAIDNFWKDYKQYVPADPGDNVIGGFVGYLAGTNYVSISKQVKLYSDCTIEDCGIVYQDIANMFKNQGSFDDIVKALKDGEYLFLQKFEFEDVPSGNYVFRVGGHRTGFTLGYDKTSTYIKGSETLDCATGGDFTPAIAKDYELVINVCDYDYDSLQEGLVMKLLDLTLPSFTDQAIYIKNRFDYNLVSEFYLFEDDDYSVPFEEQSVSFEYGSFKYRITGIVHDISDGYLVPNPYNVPLLIKASDVENTNTDTLTDHNGFAFVREQFYRVRTIGNLASGALFDFTFFFTEPKLGEITVSYVNECSTSSMTFTVGPTQVIPNVSLLSNKNYRGLKGTVSKSTSTYNNPCNRTQITGKVLDLDGNRLAGINIGYTGSQFVHTDGFGIFTLIAHNNTSFNRSDYLIISNSGGGCNIVCDEGCDTCCDSMFEEIPLDCGSGSDIEDCPEVIIDKGTYYFKKVNFPDKGLKGRYGFGVAGWDCFGRLVTGGIANIGYVDTPECWSKHPLVNWAWDGTQLRDEIKYLTFFRTKNLNGSILQWVADKFILVDSDGNETSNRGRAVAVAVDMTSLLDYNRQHNLNTLVSYSFVKGDMLRIIQDCENPIQYLVTGSTFGTTETTALQQELQVTTGGTTATAKTNTATSNGGRIIIPYDSRLDAYLDKCNIKIEIVRPYQCTSSLEPYCEVSDVLVVKNGQLFNDRAGVIETWDTYKIFRNIPAQIGCENNPSDDPYFSNNITDFWGENCTDCGRKLSENPYAQRRWIENEFALSKAFINNGVLNGLSTFWNEDVKNFKNQNWGAGVAVNAQRGVLFFICENDYFVTNYNQNYLRATESGYVQATPADTIGEPNVKVGMNFGCSFEDKATISFFNGNIFWLDSKNQSLAFSPDYQNVLDVSEKYGYKSYIVNKTAYVKKYNESIQSDYDYLYNLIETRAGICPLHGEYNLTFRPRKGLTTDSDAYVNLEREYFDFINETIVAEYSSGVLINFRPYTAEFYGKLRASITGIQFISFKHGKPYMHNGDTNGFNNFYGVQCSPVIEFCANLIDNKVKIFQSISEEIQPFALYIDRIYTEEPNSYSYVPQVDFVKKENVQYAAILRDMSSFFDPNKYQVSMLIDGKRMFGRAAVIRLTTTEENANSFFKLSKIWILLSGSELSMKPQIQQ